MHETQYIDIEVGRQIQTQKYICTFTYTSIYTYTEWGKSWFTIVSKENNTIINNNIRINSVFILINLLLSHPVHVLVWGGRPVWAIGWKSFQRRVKGGASPWWLARVSLGGEGCEDSWGVPRWGGRWSRQGLNGEQPAGQRVIVRRRKLVEGTALLYP